MKASIGKLGIDPEKLAVAPKLSEILGYAQGGTDAVINAMRFSHDAQIEAFLDCYDEASVTDRRLLPMEAFALLAEVDIPQLLGAIILALGQQSANIIKVMLPTHHPATVKARIKNALKPGGYRDRNAIDTAMRLLPTPKGTTIIIDPIRGTGQVESEAVDPEDVDTDDLFPDLLETQKMLTEG